MGRTYKNSNTLYIITTNAQSTNVTYCSETAWQAYRYGAESSAVSNTTRIVIPYSLDTEARNVSQL